MSAGESTPAPASVEQAARAAALTIVVYEVPEGWMAASLERWLFAQGATADLAVAELGRVMRVHVEVATSKGREPYTYLPSAPQRIVAKSLAGYSDAASTDRAALERANELLREALEALHGEHERQRVSMAPLRTAISEHLGEPHA